MQQLLERTAWIFDLDGTLTRPVHDFQRIRAELGIAPEQDILACIAAQPEPVRGALEARLDRWERFYAARALAAEGTLELLHRLHARGANLGILTRNTQEIALLSLEAIGGRTYFVTEDVLGRDDARPKPDPHGIEILLQQWGKCPDDAVMVGDYKYDLEAGRAVGVATVHVDLRPRQWPALTDYRLTHLGQLLPLFA